MGFYFKMSRVFVFEAVFTFFPSDSEQTKARSERRAYCACEMKIGEGNVEEPVIVYGLGL